MWFVLFLFFSLYIILYLPFVVVVVPVSIRLSLKEKNIRDMIAFSVVRLDRARHTKTLQMWEHKFRANTLWPTNAEYTATHFRMEWLLHGNHTPTASFSSSFFFSSLSRMWQTLIPIQCLKSLRRREMERKQERDREIHWNEWASMKWNVHCTSTCARMPFHFRLVPNTRFSINMLNNLCRNNSNLVQPIRTVCVCVSVRMWMCIYIVFCRKSELSSPRSAHYTWRHGWPSSLLSLLEFSFKCYRVAHYSRIGRRQRLQSSQQYALSDSLLIVLLLLFYGDGLLANGWHSILQHGAVAPLIWINLRFATDIYVPICWVAV